MAAALCIKPSKALARENTVLLNQQLRIAEANADLQKDIAYIMDFIEETAQEPQDNDMLLDTWCLAPGRRLSISAIRSAILPDEHSPTPHHTTLGRQLGTEIKLVQRAVRRHAPDMSVHREVEPEMVVGLRDIELRDFGIDADSWRVGETSSNKRPSVSLALKRWLESPGSDVEDEGAEPQGDMVVFEAEAATPFSISEPSQPAPDAAQPQLSPVGSSMHAPSPLSSSSIHSQTTNQATTSRSPTTFSFDLPEPAESDDDDEYVPDQSPRKRVRCGSTSGAGFTPASPTKARVDTAERMPKRARNPTASIKLYCLYIGCSSASIPFTNLRDRNRHMEVHFPDREHPKCAACHKPMSRPDSVKRHQNSTTGRSCRTALMGKRPCTVVKKPWDVSPWRKDLEMPPEHDPLYALAMEMQGRTGESTVSVSYS